MARFADLSNHVHPVAWLLAASALLAVPAVAQVGGIVGQTAQSSDGKPAAKSDGIAFTSHRAIYNIKLDSARQGSGVADMTGRMVYELVGNACDGYTQNMRFVTAMTNRQGDQQLNDLRTSSWEGGAAEQLRFQSSQFLDKKLAEATQGDADRGDDGDKIDVTLVKPKARGLELDGDTYFPIQHSIALMKAARRGQNRFAANLYDGSDTGDKVYETNAFIGSRVPGQKAATGGGQDGDASGGDDKAQTRPLATPPAGPLKKLAHLPSWPVAISYFEPDADETDAVPVYELSFRFFENGVSSKLRIDYGEFAIRGELAELKFFDPAPCDKKS